VARSLGWGTGQPLGVRSDYGTFFRTIPLPEGADENRVAATFRNGVVEIRIPVSDREQGRRVKVQS
jgi:HSP20 family protein